MTEQEWLEHHADLWMRDPNFTPVFSGDLPPVSDHGCRVVLKMPTARTSNPWQRIKAAKEVEFYAVFDGHEVTTRRLMNEITWSR